MADFTRGDVAHLLRRAGFFASTEEVDALAAKASWDEVVEAVLDTDANPPDSTPAVVANPDADPTQRLIAAIVAWIDRMVTTPTPLVEKVTWFWHGILTSSAPEAEVLTVHRQIQTWRRLGLGDIEDLMAAMAVDPAMLQYLDNATNQKLAPNENFARELMELFTMGNFTFSEDDVKALARAWTGHNLRLATYEYVFRADRHDDGPKTLFGITRNWDGPETITEILRGSKQPVSARYLAGRIWGAFAAPNPPGPLLDALRDALIGVDWNMRDFLRVVFARPEFRDPATKLALVRSPVEWEVAILRATGTTPAQLGLQQVQQRLGQVPLRPPNVSGWRQNRAWISSSAVWAKGQVATNLQAALQSSGAVSSWNALSATDAVDAAFDRFGVDEPAAATRGRLETFVAGERSAGRAATASSTLAALMTLTPDFQLA
jgi:uncharacterized protein (DUF1800 family)